MTANFELWDYVRGLMADRDWSQTEVVKRMGRDRGIFNRLQSGRMPSHEMLQELAAVFGVPVAELLVRVGYPPEGLGATLAAQPRELRHDELVRVAGSRLTHDELLGLVRVRMHDLDLSDVDDDDVLDAHEEAPAVETGERERTGRRRPRIVHDGSPPTSRPGDDAPASSASSTSR